MGCIGSHLSQLITSSANLEREIRLGRRRTVFPVLNVDELGRELSPGKLEVTESDLVLHMSGKPSLAWPLRSLRRYGYDNDLFSFEAGRRCPTGAGIYAFKCAEAQRLFELLQAKIQGNPQPLPLLPPPPPTSAQTATNLSPLSLSPTFDYVNIPEARNNNSPPDLPSPLYANVESGAPNGTAPPALLYTNLDWAGGRPELNYAELDLEAQALEALPAPSPPSPTHTALRLTQTTVRTTTTTSSTTTRGQEGGALGYATIDFDRTAALSVVTRSKVKLDLGPSSAEREDSEELSTTLLATSSAIRKTRHNSTAL